MGTEEVAGKEAGVGGPGDNGVGVNVSELDARRGVAADACRVISRFDCCCIARFGHFMLMTSERSSSRVGRPFLTDESKRNRRTTAARGTNPGVCISRMALSYARCAFSDFNTEMTSNWHSLGNLNFVLQK